MASASVNRIRVPRAPSARVSRVSCDSARLAVRGELPLLGCDLLAAQPRGEPPRARATARLRQVVARELTQLTCERFFVGALFEALLGLALVLLDEAVERGDQAVATTDLDLRHPQRARERAHDRVQIRERLARERDPGHREAPIERVVGEPQLGLVSSLAYEHRDAAHLRDREVFERLGARADHPGQPVVPLHHRGRRVVAAEAVRQEPCPAALGA